MRIPKVAAGVRVPGLHTRRPEAWPGFSQTPVNVEMAKVERLKMPARSGPPPRCRQEAISRYSGRRYTARPPRRVVRDTRVVPPTSMGLDDVEGTVDFVFAFAVVHEMPGPAPFFSEATRALKRGATLLLAEPAGHVDDQEFAGELAVAAQAGLTVVSHPSIRSYRTALLCKPAA